MQGIEPKVHTSLTSRMEYFRVVLQEAVDETDSQTSDILVKISELDELYKDYLLNKRNLEKSIRNYREYHDDLRKKLTTRLRELRKKPKRNNGNT
ncbi:hypothetical protein BBI01_07105 [Chryseobacterium artocarpi]|uniref:Uncharacterized protein n=1 Tax=Chryseobacterium artocarpi TaxID=1414727 RepID=A0A1B8ZY16_9FLAO|nr:hypothetical protein [Chryseobacterium artocarpi]OCA76444.1 hypothetical protein BBI01_07105 [Chryseobacterium artocarpi]